MIPSLRYNILAIEREDETDEKEQIVKLLAEESHSNGVKESFRV